MLHGVMTHYNESDVVILCAAVADFRPKEVAQHKIKSKTESLSLELSPTIDIAAHLGRIKGNQLLVGFALETQDALKHAKSKLEKKNLDLIVLNSLEDQGVGRKEAIAMVAQITGTPKRSVFDAVVAHKAH